MQKIAMMRTFSQKDLMQLLYVCSELLHTAYQDTQYEEFMEASYEASIASEYLSSQFELHNQSYRLH